MGALDFLKEFEGRALDAASYKLLQRNYEMQEENNRLLKDKVDSLESTVSELRKQNDKLSLENSKLSEIVRQFEEKMKFKIREGIAFKINKDGHAEPTPYCPNCHLAMSHTSSLPLYKCPKCEYIVQSKRSADALACELNSQNSTETD
jgi:regulator of replication initiation timing